MISEQIKAEVKEIVEQYGKVDVSLVSKSRPSHGKWGGYHHLALVLHDPDREPRRIDERLPEVYKILYGSGDLHKGNTDRSEYWQKHAEMEQEEDEIRVLIQELTEEES